MHHREMMNGVAFYRVDPDVNGNPRYVFHFLELARDYDTAVKLAKRFGGKRYRAKWFGGGIVVQSYSLADTAHYVLANRLSYGN